ncbi:transcription elongation factor GreA [Bowdeniella nasicola]|uniref:Transcription elongation factor GreA n=1 Tax=Bowdeniella nasicola TaxID=208480 RepID=A0A1Q5Q241_9ACTO|nr:transcription elongation factor GreA [Bowdeniella nasicola]OKL53901.1 transcription elongation factor GreA [Bowdeniella nasicola]
MYGGTVTETWLTQESYDRLSAELEHLSTTGRAEVVARIDAARQEGDLKENGGYHAAREEQSKLEARIVQLTELLRDAQVGEAPADDGIAESGTVVHAKVNGKDITFLIGSREAAADVDPSLKVFSESSPIGEAVIGHKVGETVSYEAPNGSTIKVKITKVKPFRG